ncbi:hypothetical protein [Bacillus sp. FSL K6-3431]|uniref:hypothetical protein n=1 Tax=Bacillus sp. FSL K6-3431 TaxID=2921500 RepID=UPI0030F8926E
MTSSKSTWFNNLGCSSILIGITILIIAMIAGKTGIGFALIGFFFCLSIGFFIASTSLEKANKEKQKKYIETIRPTDQSFHETQAFTSFDALTRIAIDEKRASFCIWQPTFETKKSNKSIHYDVHQYSYSDLLAIEMSENDVSIGTVSRSSQSAREWLDGLLTEEDRTIVGGQSEHQKSANTISSMELKLIVKDLTLPLHIIHFYKYISGTGDSILKTETPAYQSHLNELRHWYILLNFIIKEADKIDDQTSTEIIEEIETVLDDQHHQTPMSCFDKVMEPIEVDSLTDFEKLLENNKRKQLGVNDPS